MAHEAGLIDISVAGGVWGAVNGSAQDGKAGLIWMHLQATKVEDEFMKRNIGIAITLLALAIGFSVPLPAQQSSPEDKSDLMDPGAMEALNTMGTYLRTLKDFQVTAVITSEDVLTDGEKLTYTHTTDILAVTPNKLRVDTQGDQKSRLILYDGKTFTFFARRAGFYATVPAPPTIGELIDVASDKYGIEIPLLDLFLWGGPRASTNTITDASDFGPADVDGITCEHYAFRQPGLDWQVWIQLGDHPLPKKLVLTTTTDDARPQHTTDFTWNLAPSYNDAAFVFDPPADAEKIVFADEKQAAASSN
ncbi:MAG: DUF2092 domain-containing protein [Terracidiphilus sp.]